MKTIVGINHQFLYPNAMIDPAEHKKTLAILSQNELVSALDCWLWRGEWAKEEAKILRSSGKIINYNVGDRFGEALSKPASPDASDREYAFSTYMREIEYGLSLDSKKIVIGSGSDYPCERDAAKERFFEFIMKIGERLPSDVTLALEPTDRDIDKHFLYGPLGETVELVKRVRKAGFLNFGILLDMCHIPLVYETLDSAIEKVKDTLVHVHLGNCMLKDKNDPLYGDKHPAWDYTGGEFSSEDGAHFIRRLRDIGYFDKDNNTVSFEMRTMEGRSPEESLCHFVGVFYGAQGL